MLRLIADDCWWVNPNDELNDQFIVTAFLERLTERPESKSKTIEQFDCLFFRNRCIKLTEDSKFLLVVGNNNNGLLFEVGSIDGNILTGMAALRLLRKLLSPEFCPEAHKFLEILSRLDSDSYLRAMGLEKFFTHNFPDIRPDVFYVLESLARVTPGLDVRSILSNWADLRFSLCTSRRLIPQQRSSRLRTSHNKDRKSRHPMSTNGSTSVLDRSLASPLIRATSSTVVQTSQHYPPSPSNPITNITAVPNPALNFDSTSIEPRDTLHDLLPAIILMREGLLQNPHQKNNISYSGLNDSGSAKDGTSESGLQSIGEVSSRAHSSHRIKSTNEDFIPSSNAFICSPFASLRGDTWQWVRIPEIFEPYNLRFRYRRNLEDLCDLYCPIDPLTLPPPTHSVSKTISYASAVSGNSRIILGREIPIYSDTINSDIRISSLIPKSSTLPAFVVEAAMTLPFSVALVAAILFDFRKTIEEVLSNPASVDLLTTSQIDSLMNLHGAHWLPKIRLWEDSEVTDRPNWRVTDFVIESSCPPDSLISATADRVLTYEADYLSDPSSDKMNCHELYIISEHDYGCYQFPGLPDLNSNNRRTQSQYPFDNNKLVSADKHPQSYLPRDAPCTHLPVKQQSVIPGSPTSRISLKDSSSRLNESLEDIRNSRNLEYRILSTGPDSCRFTFTMILPHRTVHILSSELLGESAEIFKAVWNIIYLAKTLSPFFSQCTLPSVSASAQTAYHDSEESQEHMKFS